MGRRAQQRAWQLLERSLPPKIFAIARYRKQLTVASTVIPGRSYQLNGCTANQRNHWVEVFQEVGSGRLEQIARF